MPLFARAGVVDGMHPDEEEAHDTGDERAGCANDARELVEGQGAEDFDFVAVSYYLQR